MVVIWKKFQQNENLERYFYFVVETDTLFWKLGYFIIKKNDDKLAFEKYVQFAFIWSKERFVLDLYWI